MEKTFSLLTDGFRYIESFTNLERGDFSPRQLRLDRMHRLLDLFGNPQNAFRTIHVAGSKGKGSTSLFIASILSEAGNRTGLYTSPHVSSYRERFTLAGTFLPDELLLSCINDIERVLRSLDVEQLPGSAQPTTFELLTLLGFLAFRQAGCSFAVIETGIGGRLDATNTIIPEASVITAIELEHTEYLGNTLPEIAREKGGIIKDGVPVFIGLQNDEVREVLNNIALDRGSEIKFLHDELLSCVADTGLTGTETALTFRDGFSLKTKLRLLGDFQSENAALAALTVHTLFPRIEIGHYMNGLSKAVLPGRMELISSEPPIIIDAAHTPASVRRILSSFRSLYPSGGILIFGSVIGKNPEQMAETLAGEFETIIISTPGYFKKSDPRAVYEVFKRKSTASRLIESPAKALEYALERSQGKIPILVTGSFYMIAEIRSEVLRIPSTSDSGS